MRTNGYLIAGPEAAIALRILILHSRYLSGDASGENRVVEDETELLRDAGHHVHMWDPSPAEAGPLRLMKTGAATVWSDSARRTIRQLVAEQAIDVVHFHNLFPSLSPAALRLGAHGPAVVVTLHSYRLMCLPGTFLREGRICEDCLGRVPWRGVVHRCYRGSLPGSAAMATSLTVHQKLLDSFGRVDLFLAVSAFMKDKYVQGGWAADRIAVKNNWSWEFPARSGPGDYFLYLGRLTEEKGLSMLLEAWKGLDARLVIAGHGPDEDKFKRLAGPNVDFAGTVPSAQVPDLLGGARALVFPSKWYEGGPRVLLEAYAAGVPVMASAIGGVAESVIDDVSGILLPHDRPQEWAAAVTRLEVDAESVRLGSGARKLWMERYSPRIGLADLESAYRRALDEHGEAGELPSGTPP
jgi:glycosyltransferase involved in cell wall biosynthesis